MSVCLADYSTEMRIALISLRHDDAFRVREPSEDADNNFAERHSVIKTRMQSLTAKQEYRNSLHCAYRIFTEEGILKFWKGTVPRVGRLIVGLDRLWRGRNADILTAERGHHIHRIREDVSSGRIDCMIICT